MNTARHDLPRHGTRVTSTPAARPEQLSLLAPNQAPLQFRLDEQTRRRGLAHIARIRQQLASQAAARSSIQTVAAIAPTAPDTVVTAARHRMVDEHGRRTAA